MNEIEKFHKSVLSNLYIKATEDLVENGNLFDAQSMLAVSVGKYDLKKICDLSDTAACFAKQIAEEEQEGSMPDDDSAGESGWDSYFYYQALKKYSQAILGEDAVLKNILDEFSPFTRPKQFEEISKSMEEYALALAYLEHDSHVLLGTMMLRNLYNYFNKFNSNLAYPFQDMAHAAEKDYMNALRS